VTENYCNLKLLQMTFILRIFTAANLNKKLVIIKKNNIRKKN